jgi:DNA polymerase-4
VNDEDVKVTFYVLAECVAERMRKHHFKGRTVQVSIRDNELGWLERQCKLDRPSFVSNDLAEAAMKLFAENWDWRKPIRSLGIRATDLVSADGHRQLSFFDANDSRLKLETLEKSIDSIRSRFGHYSVQRALFLKEKRLNANPIEENVIHPVSFFK